MVAKVSLGTVAGVWGGHSNPVCIAQCSLVVLDHWQAAALSVGEIIVDSLSLPLSLCPSSLSCPRSLSPADVGF